MVFAPDGGALRPKARPYFGVKLENGIARTAGMNSCSLGRRIRVQGRDRDDGVFVEWSWSGRGLTVENDRYGLYPLFYCARGNSICISPSLEQVVKYNSERRLNFPALGVFFRLGHFVGEDTPFSDVYFLPPSCRLKWENGDLNIERIGSMSSPSSCEKYDFDDAVEKYSLLFKQSISRRLPKDSDFTVPISGGRDSRHILFELVRQGARPESCFTVRYRPPATNEDSRIAQLITERLGVNHIEIQKPSSFFSAELSDVFYTNYCGGGHGWILPLASELAGRFSTTYDGLAGDVLSAGFMASETKTELFRSGDFSGLAQTILGESKNEELLRKLFARGFYESIAIQGAIERLVRELKVHADERNPLMSFLFWNRTRRCIGSIPFGVLHEVPVVHVPYLDHDLYDFFFSLEPELVAGNRLHDETIRRSYPEFCDIPYENKRAVPVFSSADLSYYSQARRELFGYMCRTSSRERKHVNVSYILSKVGVDMLVGRRTAPWYLRAAVQAIELERLV